MTKNETPLRKPSVLMPGGKYVNLPVTGVQDCFVLLWNLGPNRVNEIRPDQVAAIYKQAGKLLKANAWQMPPKPKAEKAPAKKK